MNNYFLFFLVNPQLSKSAFDNSFQVYVTKGGQELTGSIAYRHYKKVGIEIYYLKQYFICGSLVLYFLFTVLVLKLRWKLTKVCHFWKNYISFSFHFWLSSRAHDSLDLVKPNLKLKWLYYIADFKKRSLFDSAHTFYKCSVFTKEEKAFCQV